MVFATVAATSAQGAEMDDTQAIQVVLDGFVEAWNHHDMKAFGELFDDDATFVNIRGMLWGGRAEIETAHKAIHSSFYKGSHIQNQVESLRFLAPEVAVALVRSDLTGDERSPGATRQTRSTLVLAKRTRWRITAAHNSEIALVGVQQPK
jgi:uncharacterized protein (TIGR02246 family)